MKAPEGRTYDEDDPNLLTAAQLGSVVDAMPQRWRAALLRIASTAKRTVPLEPEMEKEYRLKI